MANRPQALFAMRAEYLPTIFPSDVLRKLQRLADIDATLVAERFDDARVLAALARTEILVTGWGCPPLDAAVLNQAPRLSAVLHAAGSVKAHVTRACWERGLTISSAAEANAIPVAEYTLAAILLAGKDAFSLHETYRRERGFVLAKVVPDVGNFGRRVGIVGASRIGRRVIELLRPFDLRISLSDPYLDEAGARALGVNLVSLDDLLRGSDIVSLHAPAIPETHHMIGPARLALMPDRAMLINTAHGSLIEPDALASELVTGRISAVLDVTEPEPLPADSPLFDLPNVFLSPHIAGSHGNELRRLGLCVVDDLRRLLDGEPLACQVHHADLDRAA